MYIAELGGKLSRTNENKEDLLTSNVFSFFKYAPRDVFLFQFIQSIGLEVSSQEAIEAEFNFWPVFEDKTEPDLVIIVGKYYLLIEAKFHSGFGQENESIKHQLVREIEGGLQEANNLGKEFKLLIVTADYYLDRTKYRDIPNEIWDMLLWINWQKIAILVYNLFQDHKHISAESYLFAEDFYNLLVKKNLRSFEGISPLSNIGRIKPLSGIVFFNASTAKFRGNFFGFINSLPIQSEISNSTEFIFWEENHE